MLFTQDMTFQFDAMYPEVHYSYINKHLQGQGIRGGNFAEEFLKPECDDDIQSCVLS